jgi:hypothetical protein
MITYIKASLVQRAKKQNKALSTKCLSERYYAWQAINLATKDNPPIFSDWDKYICMVNFPLLTKLLSNLNKMVLRTLYIQKKKNCRSNVEADIVWPMCSINSAQWNLWCVINLYVLPIILTWTTYIAANRSMIWWFTW